MATQKLPVWAEHITIDAETLVAQRREIRDEEFRDGLLKEMSFSAQQYNSILFLLTAYSSPYWATPHLIKNTIPIPDTALEMNGQSFQQEDAPELYEIYTGLLDDLTSSAPAGYTYIIRKR